MAIFLTSHRQKSADKMCLLTHVLLCVYVHVAWVHLLGLYTCCVGISTSLVVHQHADLHTLSDIDSHTHHYCSWIFVHMCDMTHMYDMDHQYVWHGHSFSHAPLLNMAVAFLANRRQHLTHMHTYTHTHACTHAQTLTDTHTLTHARTHAHTRTHTHTHTHAHTHTRTRRHAR